MPVLFAKLLGVRDVRLALASAPDPPDPKAVGDALDNLRRMDAVAPSGAGCGDEQLTPIGRVLADRD